MSRFLFISTVEGLPWGGSEALWTEVAHRLLERGHHVAYSCKYFADEPYELACLRKAGAVAHYRDAPQQKKILSRVGRVADRIRWRHRKAVLNKDHWLSALVIDEQPDLVILNCYYAYSVWSLSEVFSAIKSAGIAYTIISQLEDDMYVLREQPVRALRALYGGALEVSCGSRQGLDLLQRQFVVSIEHRAVFDNPVNCSRQLCDWPDGESATRRFACVGRMGLASKGQDLLLEAFADPVWHDRDWHLTFYGRGWQEAHLIDLIQFYGLEEHVTIAGFQGDIDQVWAREEVCLQPSFKEGTPMTFVEAMFCGRPCLVSDVGRMPELVEEGVHGWVCSRGKLSVAATLERAWSARDGWAAMGRSAHLQARNRWDSNYAGTMADRYISYAAG